MKISLNLATLSSPRERYALAWALPLALFGVFGLVMLCYSAISSFRQYDTISKNVDDFVRREQALKDRETALRKNLDQPQNRDIFRKAQFVNGLIEERQLSVIELTKKVSKLLPSSVRLTSLAVARQKDDIVVRFSVVGHDEDGLETFMENLEGSRDFKDPAVSNQASQRTAAAAKTVAAAADADVDHVGIVCSAHYVGDGAK